ncbi:MAG: efflux RND transporter periplasmic adaptor subunit [Deltaproteobacteria bacterium]|nr:efflux RND transporter periplasmic adaptor subunit [Deltaproteobacteria bacterium]
MLLIATAAAVIIAAEPPAQAQDSVHVHIGDGNSAAAPASEAISGPAPVPPGPEAAGRPASGAASAPAGPNPSGSGDDGAYLDGQGRRVLYWYDPMYPGTRFDKPGKSPFMDMDLVPRYADDSGGEGVVIDPVQLQNLGVRTQKAELGRLAFSRDFPAEVDFNGYATARIQPRAGGFVSVTVPLAVGDRIAKGDGIAVVTVPAWASDQSEYLLLKSQKAGRSIIQGVREKMRLSGMPEEMLAEVDRTGQVQTELTVSSPVDGVVTELDVYPGMNVEKEMTLAVVRGTDPAWVTAWVPERDLHLARGRARLTLPAFPDRAFEIIELAVLPNADPATRAVPVRVSVKNPEGRLIPGMTARLRLRATEPEAVLVPTQSLIDLGEDDRRVLTRAPDGSFLPKRVTVGRSSRDRTQVLSGLEPGEEVVTVGLFLIDSEANLRGALERLRGDKEAPGASEMDGSAAEPELESRG